MFCAFPQKLVTPVIRCQDFFGSNGHGQTLKWVGAAGLGVLGGAALGLQKQQDPASGKISSPEDAMLNGVAVALLDRAQQISREFENTEPLIEFPAQTEFLILFSGE